MSTNRQSLMQIVSRKLFMSYGFDSSSAHMLPTIPWQSPNSLPISYPLSKLSYPMYLFTPPMAPITQSLDAYAGRDLSQGLQRQHLAPGPTLGAGMPIFFELSSTACVADPAPFVCRARSLLVPRAQCFVGGCFHGCSSIKIKRFFNYYMFFDPKKGIKFTPRF
jgi:hypothetical protein